MLRFLYFLGALALVLGSSVAGVPSQKAIPAAADDPNFLANWMHHALPVLQSSTILDLSLPGSHDSQTYDLSTTVSDGANDLDPTLSWILHTFKGMFGIGAFIRDQAKTQGLSIVDQLNNGIRFIDFRIMYTAGPDGSSLGHHDWYCLHLLESNERAMVYLTEARKWLDDHPDELVVFWLSRHGNECHTQYPDVGQAEMLKFWAQYEALFEGLLFDRAQSSLNGTTVGELLHKNHRVVSFVSDFAKFTNGTTKAIDGCDIDNQTGDDSMDEAKNVPQLLAELKAAGAVKAADKRQGRFYLRSMAAGAGGQEKLAALIKYDPFSKSKHRAQCAQLFNIPGMTDWCPMALQDISQLTNYYNQIVLDAVISGGPGYELPNAVYLDAVDVGGLIRTGTDLFGPANRAGSGDAHGSTGFCYVDTFILYNINRVCAAKSMPQCGELQQLLAARRKLHPLTRWDDAAHGRLAAWPKLP